MERYNVTPNIGEVWKLKPLKDGIKRYALLLNNRNNRFEAVVYGMDGEDASTFFAYAIGKVHRTWLDSYIGSCVKDDLFEELIVDATEPECEDGYVFEQLKLDILAFPRRRKRRRRLWYLKYPQTLVEISWFYRINLS